MNIKKGKVNKTYELFEYVGIDADSVFIDAYTGKVTATKVVNTLL